VSARDAYKNDMGVLIVTNKYDTPSDEVIRRLENKGEAVFRLNTEDFCDSISVLMGINNGDITGMFRSRYHSIEISEIRSAFYRRPLSSDPKELGDPSVVRFVKNERTSFLDWLWEASKWPWLNHPRDIRRADSKLDQLLTAKACGLQTPETLITNDPSEAQHFYHAHRGRIVNKVLASGTIMKNGITQAVYTRPLQEADLGQLGCIQPVPCLFQKQIEKRFEVRVTIVGNDVFATAIYSQHSERTKDDWRRYDLPNTPHVEFELPENVRQSCLRIIEHYNLHFGAIDLAVTPDDAYVFFEINPNGQWLWIERLTGQRITDAIVEFLLKGHPK
jgi:glutathione synthase/RimK-type ligase-like ATP-grasp enzyme